MTSIEVHIERVVLHGLALDAAGRDRLHAAMVAALTDAPAGAADAVEPSADALRRTSTRLPAGASPAATGAGLGRAVAAALAPRAGRR